MNSIFFILSKLFLPIIEVENWIIICSIMIAFSLFVGKINEARRYSYINLFLVITLSIVPLGPMLFKYLESDYATLPKLSNVDGIIVLDGAENAYLTAMRSRPQLNESAERLTEAVFLATSFPSAQLLFSGAGGGMDNITSNQFNDTMVAEKFFNDFRIEKNRIIFERSSRNTAENARMSFDIAHPKPSETWVLVTSAFHMKRALRSFKRAGWNTVVPYPVDFKTDGVALNLTWDISGNIKLLDLGIKELVGRVAYNLSNR